MKNQDLEITFRKSGAVRFVSHLDLLRIFDQTARRSGLPVKFTQGFNPKVRLSSQRALPLGVESECEVLVIGMVEPVEPARAKEALNAQLPDALKVLTVGVPGPLARGVDVIEEYEILFEDPDGAVPEATIQAILAREALFVTRRKKDGTERHLDIRPMIRALSRIPGGLRLVLESVDRRSARVSEVIAALSEVPHTVPPTRLVVKKHQRPSASEGTIPETGS